MKQDTVPFFLIGVQNSPAITRDHTKLASTQDGGNESIVTHLESVPAVQARKRKNGLFSRPTVLSSPHHYSWNHSRTELSYKSASDVVDQNQEVVYQLTFSLAATANELTSQNRCQSARLAISNGANLNQRESTLNINRQKSSPHRQTNVMNKQPGTTGSSFRRNVRKIRRNNFNMILSPPP